MSSEHTAPATIEYAIEVHDLSKCYQIYDKPSNRLKQMLMRGRKKYYKEFWALRDVSFKVKKGETVGIIGRNGSGKSTLLQMICGTLNPTQGSINVNGRVAALLELGAGFNSEFTGIENIFMTAGLYGMGKEEIDVRLDSILSFADIGDHISQPVKTYSSGMYVRLAFAVIAHVNADVLVIDEALAVGDASFTQKCMRFLRKFQETGTILFVSHDIGSINALCNYAIWLDAGQLKTHGQPKEVCAKYFELIYETQQGLSQTKYGNSSTAAVKNSNPAFPASLNLKDMRLEFINHTKFRNDIELFAFSENSQSFGKRGVSIVNVTLHDDDGVAFKWIVGGEPVNLSIFCQAHQNVTSPIIGFFIKDRLGQVLFGDNTFLTYKNHHIEIGSDRSFSATFSFNMPILPAGEYSINVAVAEGTQQDHIQHEWIHDALIFRSTSSSITTGLVGLPMRSITLTTTN